MKLNIAICDDERAEIDYLLQLAGQWADARGIAAAFTTYESAESFLFHYADRPNAELVLLDVQMGHLSGIELAKQIRRDNDSMQIVFITGYPDFMGEGYEVSALHYLMKPVKAEKLFEVLDRAQARLQTVPRTLLLPRGGGSIRIKADDIVYAEVLSHTTTLHLTTGTEDFQMRLSDMERALGEGFIRCHRSYLVSMRYVRRVTRTAVVLENGRELPLSRDLYDAVNQAFIQYN
ncbi:LytTR family DNA-binding domain-containing protein [Paenibacillus sp. NFR01]|uniref:LytR/AlgR family response regulator transcription factor n=1 Tax=Paenibacillus sp. NFR01 TaxID=1566279 RepID=UPI0008B7DAAB|nr:LytTR family DNA-binding domain-containing protein [Paenibacillus sp. NFR01]SET09907.1 two component transcriptional regulator, LytTR family [Paenibacillus sp. NFR01]